MRDSSLKEGFVLMLGAGFVIAFFFYGSLIHDSALCYKVPVCPALRTVLTR